MRRGRSAFSVVILVTGVVEMRRVTSFLPSSLPTIVRGNTRRCSTDCHYSYPQQKRSTIRYFSSPASSSSDHSSSSASKSAAESIRQRKLKQLQAATKLSLAPMMEYTDRHFRHMVRLLSTKTLLYTEMVAANTLSYERADCIKAYQQDRPLESSSMSSVRQNYQGTDHLRRFLSQGQIEPLEGASVLQLGGSDVDQMYQAAQAVMDMTQRGGQQQENGRGCCDYTAINLNCGCPSPKVAGKGCFGAALMEEPQLVADLTQALHEGCDGTMPITVKCRIGTDTHRSFSKKNPHADDSSASAEEEYQSLCHFIETVASNGIVTDFSVHARIAVLQKSFSPADNRNIPPLKYDLVRRLVHDYPEFTFSLNGGIESISQAKTEFETCPNLAGVMIGRSFAADPWSFAMADQLLYGDNNAAAARPRNRLELLKEYGKHADYEESIGDPTKIRRFITKAITPLFTGEARSKRYRIALDEIGRIPKALAKEGKSLDSQPKLSELIMTAAMEHLSEEALYRTPEESYERTLAMEKRKNEGNDQSIGRSVAVAAWQSRRKEAEAAASA